MTMNLLKSVGLIGGLVFFGAVGVVGYVGNQITIGMSDRTTINRNKTLKSV